MSEKKQAPEKPAKELPWGRTELPMTVAQLGALGLLSGSDELESIGLH